MSYTVDENNNWQPLPITNLNIDIPSDSRENKYTSNKVKYRLDIKVNLYPAQFYCLNKLPSYPTPSSHVLNALYTKGFSIWMNLYGEICFKTISVNRIYKISYTKLGDLLHNIFKRDIFVILRDSQYDVFLRNMKSKENKYERYKKMGDEMPNSIKDFVHDAETIITLDGIPFKKIQAPYASIIRVVDLPIISEDEVFEPFEKYDYVLKPDSIYYKNAYHPTNYINNPNKNLSLENSITIQFLFYLSGYNEEKFTYIVNWLALLINNLSTNCSKSVAKELLILIGDKKSGKDILCQNIIEPIIGREFCLNMDEEILNSKNAEKKLKNKLFLNIHNINLSMIQEFKQKNLLYNTLHEHDFIFNPYLQKILMLESNNFIFEPQCPYNVFTVPNDLERDFYTTDKGGAKQYYKKDELIRLISNDLENFISWLNTQGDVRNYYDLSKTIRDQELTFNKSKTDYEILKEFTDYITSNDITALLRENIDFTDTNKTREKEIEQMEHLYKKDFRVNKRYIRKLFFKLYGKKKNLYTELEKFNPELFKKVKGYDGKPCFVIPKYS